VIAGRSSRFWNRNGCARAARRNWGAALACTDVKKIGTGERVMKTQLEAYSGFSIPRPQISYQHLIISLFGLYSRTPGAALPVAALVSLLDDLGYDEPGVRSAISRLKAKGTLRAVSVGQVAAYELTQSLRATFMEGDERIFAERL